MSAELVERLIHTREYHAMMYDQYEAVTEAAAVIEAQAAEIVRLRGVLDRIYMEDRRIAERWRQSAVTGDSHLEERIVLGRYAEMALAALENKP